MNLQIAAIESARAAHATKRDVIVREFGIADDFFPDSFFDAYLADPSADETIRWHRDLLARWDSHQRDLYEALDANDVADPTTGGRVTDEGHNFLFDESLWLLHAQRAVYEGAVDYYLSDCACSDHPAV